MSNRKQTKRALLTSVMALVMCVVMLVGTTFAWFTDTATTSVNKIEAGNLDVALYYGDTADGANGTNWTELVDGSPALKFLQSNGTTATQQDFYWEPGGTYSLPALKVANKGNLNLKYKIEITGIKGSDKLNEVIDWTMKLGSDEFVIGSEHVLNAATAGTESADILTISGHMWETAGNIYMNEKIEGITITLKATQATGEYDSTRNDYDENATYPDVAFVTVAAPTAEETAAGVNPLANALTAASAETNADGSAKEKITADLGAGTFTLTEKEGKSKAATAGKEITLAGAGKENTTFAVEKTDVNAEANGTYCFDGTKSVVLKDMTIKFNSGNYRGFNRVGNIRLENCTIVGMASEWATGDVEFVKCNFVFGEDHNQWTNSLWTRTGSSFTFTDCTFTSENGKFINVYREGNNGVVDITLNNCKFINNAAAANKAAVNIKSQFAWNVTINNCTTVGAFPTENNGLWQSKPDYGTAAAGNKVTVNP